MTTEQKKGRLLAAGPIGGTDHGRYIIAAASKAFAESCTYLGATRAWHVYEVMA